MKTKEKQETRPMNRIEEFFAGLFPKWGNNRIAYKANRDIYGYNTSYHAANRRSLRDWIPGGKSADEALIPELSILRQRSQDLARNNPEASSLINSLVTHVVGKGLLPQSRLDYKELGIDQQRASEIQKKIEKNFKKWALNKYNVDAGERMTFSGMQRLVMRQIIVTGEVFIQPLRFDEQHRDYSLSLQVIDSDRIDTPNGKKDIDIRGGVEIGKRGQAIAYWIKKAKKYNQGYFSQSNDFIRMPARNKLGRQNVMHLYFFNRPGQSRGVPWLSPMMTRFKHLGDYYEAEMTAAKLCACIALYIKSTNTSTQGYGITPATEEGKAPIEDMTPGIMKRLGVGEEIQPFAPNRPGVTFDPFVERTLKSIASAASIPYEILAKDFTKSNYSSARAAILEGEKYLSVIREWFINGLCKPIYIDLVEEMYLKGELEDLEFYLYIYAITCSDWLPSGPSQVDPVKEANASILEIDNNLSSLSIECAKRGRDFEQVIEDKIREKEILESAGLNEQLVEEKV